jgi:hypothetical protein
MWLRVLEMFPAMYVPVYGSCYRMHAGQSILNPLLWNYAELAYQNDSGWASRAIDPKIAVLTTVTGGPAQDQWVYIPHEGGNIVPEPASLLIWSLLGLGSTGLAVWSRRRRGGLTETGEPRWSRENREAILSLIDRGRRA